MPLKKKRSTTYTLTSSSRAQNNLDWFLILECKYSGVNSIFTAHAKPNLLHAVTDVNVRFWSKPSDRQILGNQKNLIIFLKLQVHVASALVNGHWCSSNTKQLGKLQGGYLKIDQSILRSWRHKRGGVMPIYGVTINFLIGFLTTFDHLITV